MTLKEIVSKIEFEEFYKVLIKSYDKSKDIKIEKIQKGFNELKSLEATKNKDNISIDILLSKENDELYYDVSGMIEGDPDKYSLMDLSWEEWLGFDIHNRNFDSMSAAQIVVHCYWEMTWYGWNIDDIKENIEIDNIESKQCDLYEAEAEKIKLLGTNVSNKFLEKLIFSFENARTENFKLGIELIIKDLLKHYLFTGKQIAKIESNFLDDDIITTIKNLRNIK